MIIKSLSRKEGSGQRSKADNSGNTGCGRSQTTTRTQCQSVFAHLVRYMHRGMADEQYQPVLWQHCYGGQHTSKQEVIQLFEENAKHLAIRKNGNVLYHEIISFSAGHALTQAILTQLVADVGQEYLRQRAPTQLAYGVVHFDTEHIHLHLMISANSVGRPERVRLSKQRFAEIQQQLEHFVMTRFPELEQTQVYRDKAQGERCKLRAKEQAMTLRAKAPSRKEDLARRLADIFGQAYSQADFEYRCRAEGVRIYQRGNSLGVLVHEVDGAERNHRLSTLGVMHAYEAMQDRFLEHVSDEISHLWDSVSESEWIHTLGEQALVLDRVYDDASAGAISCDHDLRSSALILPTDNRILLPGEDILFQYLNMNSKQAKELSLPQFLHQLGYAPAHRRGQDIWYTSPFRPNEQTPSFKIDHAKNFWFDFGMGRGGTIIEFVQLLYATEDVARVLAIIAEVNGGATRVRQPAIPEVDRRAVVQKEKPIIESVKNISDHALESYLLARAIPLDLARLYLREIAYRIGGRWYRALAFANDAKGYEIRNPGFKGTLGKKDISFLVSPERKDTAVFEGVFDFLAMLTYFQQDHPASNVLVLNSVGLIERGIERLNAYEMRRYHSYLDHDEAGLKALTTLRERLPGEVIDGSDFYLGYKDANEFLMHHHRRQFPRRQMEIEL